MSILCSCSRGRIVGISLLAFLGGVALVILGLVPLAWMIGIEALFVIGIGALCLRPPQKYLVILLCVSAGCLGMLRAWMDQVPLLVLARPNTAMRQASLTRTRLQKEVVPDWMVGLRQRLTDRIQANLPKEEAALLSGILYGERLFSSDTQKTFRRAGLMHIVAVSGANISVIVLVMGRVLLRLRRSRTQTWALLVGCITAFVLFVAPSASVTRAAMMGVLMELAPLTGRLVRPLRLLLVTAVLFVLWQPGALLLDAGFILSFLAMLGLICLAPYIDLLLPKRCPALLRETITSTCAATVMTGPYLAWVFRSWSVLGCFTNLLIVPLIPWTMFFGALALVLPFGRLAFLPVQGCLSLILWIAHLTDAVTWGVWDKMNLSWVWMIVIYIILFTLWRLGEQRKRLIHRTEKKKIF